MKEITDEQAAYIIKQKDIPEEILNSNDKVAIVLTQDWCPQWLFMQQWLKKTETNGIKTYYISYNKKPYYQEFMNAKESGFGNDLVPYVRYYMNGKLIDESNYV
ncbi:MAG: hypothetical protein PF518_10545, partial [Spirochaetaceae bacterium]|nr:hypothetical protein [Spirochaetaceae bacterium]